VIRERLKQLGYERPSGQQVYSTGIKEFDHGGFDHRANLASNFNKPRVKTGLIRCYSDYGKVNFLTTVNRMPQSVDQPISRR
jgi:hypothetical protein